MERVFVDEGRTLLLTNFFPETRLKDFERMLELFPLRRSLVLDTLSFR